LETITHPSSLLVISYEHRDCCSFTGSSICPVNMCQGFSARYAHDLIAFHGRGRPIVPVGAGEVGLWSGDPCGRPSSFHRQRRGRPQGSPPIPSPPPPLRGRGAFSPKNLYLKGSDHSPQMRRLAFSDTNIRRKTHESPISIVMKP